MSMNLIHDRGRGPEIAGTRITVYNLLPHFFDATATESYVCELYNLTPEQVAAARAYVLNNPETVLAEHRRIEERMAAGNPPEVVERAKQTHAEFLSFKKWLVERLDTEAKEANDHPKSDHPANPAPPLPSFREWLDHQDSPRAERL